MHTQAWWWNTSQEMDSWTAQMAPERLPRGQAQLWPTILAHQLDGKHIVMEEQLNLLLGAVLIFLPLLPCPYGDSRFIPTTTVPTGTIFVHGPLTRYINLRVAHTPGILGTFSPPSRVSDPDMHHGTCVTHVSWCMLGSLTSDFLCSRWRGFTFPKFPAHAQTAILRFW